jgi:hypothetical protein
MNEHWKKSTNENKGKPEQKFYATFGTMLRISTVSVFKEASKNFILIFSCTRQVKNLKTNCSCTESIKLIVLYIPSKKIFNRLHNQFKPYADC